MNSPHKGQWREALMFSLICVWINDWVNNRGAGDLRRYRAHYDVIVMKGIRWSYVVYPHKPEYRAFLLVWTLFLTNRWVAGDLRHHNPHETSLAWNITLYIRQANGSAENDTTMTLHKIYNQTSNIIYINEDENMKTCNTKHGNLMAWKRFPYYRPYVKGMPRSYLVYPHKDQEYGAILSVKISFFTNNSVADDSRRHNP